MQIDRHKQFYERDAERFWDPAAGMAGRDLDVYPLIAGLSGKFLEYGCGSGSLLVGLAKESRFTECFGVDVSEKALARVADAWQQINTANKQKLKLLVPESDLLPSIVDQSIDLVISVATVEHVIDPYVVLDELHRITKPRGTLLCSVPNYAYLKHRIALLFGIQPRTGTDQPVENWRTAGWDGMHLHTFTKSSFDTLLRDCGWIPTYWTGCGNKFSSIGFGLLRRRFPSLLSGELIALCKKK